MIRVKNEQDFLYPSVKSIADCVDEIVIIENLSNNPTLDIIKSLKKEYPLKIKFFEYPYEVRKVGKDNWELATNKSLKSSPHLLSNYYTWCLNKCTKSYVIKWDGDMIATEMFFNSVIKFKQSPYKHILMIRGANIHPDLQHLIAPSVSKTESLQGHFFAPTSLSNWLSPYTDFEYRLFPKVFARYDSGYWWCERLRSPFVDALSRFLFRSKIYDISYLHMKYCKKDPYDNFSNDFKEIIDSNIIQGRQMSSTLLEVIKKWKLIHSR
jgi:hypothetical protein